MLLFENSKQIKNKQLNTSILKDRKSESNGLILHPVKNLGRFSVEKALTVQDGAATLFIGGCVFGESGIHLKH